MKFYLEMLLTGINRSELQGHHLGDMCYDEWASASISSKAA